MKEKENPIMSRKLTNINDKIALSNGMEIPCVGFGTYNAKGGDNYKMILDAIECGYRYFDTASLYETERDLCRAVKDSGIDRKELFIASKAWYDELDDVEAALDRSLNRIGTDYLDIYLIHWPRQYEGDNYKETDIAVYRKLEKAVEKGLIRAIGLSNFLPHHTKNILDNCKIKPVVDQLEIHPGYTQYAACLYNKENGIVNQAWSPLGRGSMMENRILEQIADKYGKSVAQLSLRYIVQEGIIPIVKSGNINRMRDNMNLFDFEINDEDMSMIRNMPQNTWLGEHPDFNIPEMKSNIAQ